MEGIDRAYLNATIRAVLSANQSLGLLSCETALKRVPSGKADTLSLDSVPENTIKGILTEEFDQTLVLITEEGGKSADLVGAYNEVVCFSDPVDGSEVLARFLWDDVSDRSARLRDIFGQPRYLDIWARKHRDPVSINGASCSVTAIKQGRVVFNVLLNLITQEIFVACEEGVRYQRIAGLSLDAIDLEDVRFDQQIKDWLPLCFPSPPLAVWERFVAYLKAEDYQRNFKSANLVDDFDPNQVAFDAPGPSRVLYLSSLCDPPMGFVLANGEKVGEWLGWLAYARFARTEQGRAFHVYEITSERPWTKGQVLMAPGEHYSILETTTTKGNGATVINLDKLRHFRNPSHYRGTILVVHPDNNLIVAKAQGQNYRRLLLD